MDIVKDPDKILRHAAAGLGQDAGPFVVGADFLWWESAVVTGFAAEGDVHRDNPDAITLGQLRRDVGAGLGDKNNATHRQSILFSISGLASGNAACGQTAAES